MPDSRTLISSGVIAGCGVGAFRLVAAAGRPAEQDPPGSPDGLISLDDVFMAIRLAETGGHPDPANAVGDSGRSLGPYQVGRAYFQDAVEHDPSLEGLEYEQVRDVEVARRVIYAYWSRYAAGPPWHAEDLCRLHNGGPSRRGTDAYWAKCRRILDGR